MFGWLIDGALFLVAVILLIASFAGFLISGKPRPKVLLLFIISLICWATGFWMVLLYKNPVQTVFWQYVSLGGMVFTMISFTMVITDYLRADEND